VRVSAYQRARSRCCSPAKVPMMSNIQGCACICSPHVQRHAEVHVRSCQACRARFASKMQRDRAACVTAHYAQAVRRASEDLLAWAPYC